MILIELAKNPEYVENLSRLDQLGYGGGPLPEAVGELITSEVRLVNGYGSAECGTSPMQLCARDDWKGITINKVCGHEFRPVSDDLYEFIIVRKPELLKYQGIFGTFPELDEWPTKDLFSKHPTAENTWLFQGRRDDIVVLSSGEKFNPLDMESTIGAHPLITGVLVAGLGQTQTSLLVETAKPVTNDAEKEERIEEIWDTVQRANKQASSHGRIHRDHIIVTSANKPFPRAGKGTIQRRMATDL